MREQLINIIREAIGEGGKYGRFYATETIRALESARLKIVGRDATEAMLTRMNHEMMFGLDVAASDLWRQAFDAAPTYGGEGE